MTIEPCGDCRVQDDPGRKENCPPDCELLELRAQVADQAATIEDAKCLAYNSTVPRTIEDQQDTLDDQLVLLIERLEARAEAAEAENKRLRGGAEPTTLELDLLAEMTAERDEARAEIERLETRLAAVRGSLEDDLENYMIISQIEGHFEAFDRADGATSGGTGPDCVVKDEGGV